MYDMVCNKGTYRSVRGWGIMATLSGVRRTGRHLSTCRNWLPVIFGLLILALAARADELPAVSGFNGKLETVGGGLDGQGVWAATGSVSAPLGHSFGIQVDGLLADYSAGPTWGGGTHLFWRDPDVGLVGVVGSRTDFDGMAVNRFGLETEYYAGPVTIAVTGGKQNGDGLRTGWGGLDLKWYPMDDLALNAGAGAISGERIGHAGFEWQVVGAFGVFADVALGTRAYDHAMGGLPGPFRRRQVPEGPPARGRSPDDDDPGDRRRGFGEVAKAGRNQHDESQRDRDRRWRQHGGRNHGRRDHGWVGRWEYERRAPGLVVKGGGVGW